MAQPGQTTIQLYSTTTTSATPSPSNLVTGELALNVTDKKVFSKDGSGNVVEMTMSPLNPSYTGTLTGGTGVVNLGSGQVYKDASGNVGIGTASPGAAIDVVRPGGFSVGRFGNGTTQISVGVSSDNSTFIEVPQARPLRFLTSGTDVAQLSAAGNLGLGVTPSAWGNGGNFQLSGANIVGNGGITVGSNMYYNGGFKYIGAGSAARYDQVAGQYHAWYTAPSGTAGNPITFTQAMTLDASSNLTVSGPSTSRLKFIETTSGNGQQLQIGAASGVAFINADAAAGNVALGFRVFNSEVGRFDTSGNLLVGTTSAGGSRLVVKGPGNSARVFKVLGDTSGDLSVSSALFSKYDNNTSTSQVFLQFSVNNDTTANGQINANGPSQAAFGAWSDRRLKENIVNLGGQLTNVLALRPVEFDYIETEGGGHQIGFIAQEMQDVFPDAVGTRSDGMLTVTGWGKTEAILVKAIQEQQVQIEAQAVSIEAMQAQINAQNEAMQLLADRLAALEAK